MNNQSNGCTNMHYVVVFDALICFLSIYSCFACFIISYILLGKGRQVFISIFSSIFIIASCYGLAWYLTASYSIDRTTVCIFWLHFDKMHSGSSISGKSFVKRHWRRGPKGVTPLLSPFPSCSYPF